MLSRIIALSALSLTLAAPVFAQTSAAGASTTLPGVTTTGPDANSGKSTDTTLPGVTTDPMKTNSTTGTVDQEDRCHSPGTSSTSNPSAQSAVLPRPEQFCN